MDFFIYFFIYFFIEVNVASRGDANGRSADHDAIELRPTGELNRLLLSKKTDTRASDLRSDNRFSILDSRTRGFACRWMRRR